MLPQIHLPKKEHILPTHKDDPLKYYYHPLVGFMYLRRLQFGVSLLPKEKIDKLLEIGCGSGIILPELYRHCHELHAIDPHENLNLVQKMARFEGVRADLFRTNILAMPFKENSYDVIFCLSVLEHIENLEIALREVHRILRKNGVAIIGMPAVNHIMSKMFELIGHPNIDFDHVSSPEKLECISRDLFVTEDVLYFPKLSSSKCYLYKCFKFRKK